MEYFDLGIIGGGPAGYSSALYALSKGKKVVLFEKDELGGTCLNRGCIPTKAFLHVADTFLKISEFDKLGLHVENPEFDYEKIVEYKNNIVSKLRKGLEFALKDVKIVKFEAKIVSKGIIEADNSRYSCGEIIIATGSKPRELKDLKYDHKFILSSDDILNLKVLPKSILIVGSGAIGIEWSRILSAFGVDVTIVELADRLCPIADWEVSKRLERQFKIKKIKTHTSSYISSVEDKKILLSNGTVVEADCILVSVGREVVSSEGVYGAKVIGDASGEMMLAHYAICQAKELILNIPFNKKLVPSVIYGSPEIAWLGDVCKSKNEEEKYKVSILPISALGKSHCDNATDGFIKILSKDGYVKGVSVVSSEASSLVQQLAVAMTNNLSVADLEKVCYAHPTYSEGIFETLVK